MYGVKTLPITLNFQDLLDQDAAGTTYFVVGGRVYFEATVSGTNTNTFISKGFFDQLGYSQPAKTANTKAILIGVFTTIAVLGLLFTICYCYKKK